MKIKTPSFWYRDKNAKTPLIETFLSPLSKLYELGVIIHREIKTPQRFTIPVICIGNLNAGGSGKTPSCIALVKLTKEYKLAKKPFFLTRGYGGHSKTPILVNAAIHTNREIGDEALLLARHAPTIVSRNRLAGAQLAQSNGADLIIMDDGLQNYDLSPDIKIIVIDGQMEFGNGKTLPAGPLREPLTQGLKKADCFILLNKRKDLPLLKPVFESTLNATIKLCDKRPWLAFSGLGYPEKFFTFLKNTLHLNIVKTVSFSDHHPYTANDIAQLEQQAAAQNAKLITTEKDAVRLPHGANIQTVPVELAWNDPQAFAKFLKSRLNA